MEATESLFFVFFFRVLFFSNRMKRFDPRGTRGIQGLGINSCKQFMERNSLLPSVCLTTDFNSPAPEESTSFLLLRVLSNNFLLYFLAAITRKINAIFEMKNLVTNVNK